MIELYSDCLIINGWKFGNNGNFEYVGGKKDMKYEELLNKIDEQIKANLYLKAHSASAVTDKVLRNNNNLLGEIKDVLYDAGEEYDRGAEDAWALARKIVCSITDDPYTCDELSDIFGYRYSVSVLESNKTYKKALAKVEAYEKKKKEEAAKPVIGDVVMIDYDPKHLAILYADLVSEYWVLEPQNKHGFYAAPQRLSKSNFTLTKTGKHFDIQGMLDEIKTED